MFNMINDENFYIIIDALHSGIHWKDAVGRYLGCNQHVLNLAGLSRREEIIGKSDFDLWDFESAKKFQENDIITMKAGTFEGEECFPLEEGKNSVYWSVKNKLQDPKGNFIGIIGNSINIDDQKKQIELKRQQEISNEKFKVSQIIDLVNASIYWKNLDGVILGCNQYVLDMFGINDSQGIVGKNEYDLISEEDAIRITKIDQSVLQNGYYEGEENFTLPSGERKIHYVVKNRLIDSDNNLIGLVGTSLDITSKKEAEQLRLENETQQAILQEQEKFRKTANQVAHDIRSPLSSLLILAKTCTNLPEKERNTLREASTRISDIANNLLSNYKNEKTVQALHSEERESVLISPILLQILTEKKYEFQKFPVEFLHHFSQAGEFSWINIQHSAFDRMISNLINNAVDALNQTAGTITLYLDSDDTNVYITIKDNGKGMSLEVQQKIIDHVALTDGKENGHGLGLTQVRETLQNNQGHWKIDSQIGEGTEFRLTFPRTQSLPWIAETVELNDDDTIVILDDDISIHLAWDLRIEKIRKKYPELTAIHYELGQETIDFINGLTLNEKKKVFLLADYELLNQNLNGLDVIEKTRISRSILVTSHYANKEIQNTASRLATRILPKQLASDIPIQVQKRQPTNEQDSPAAEPQAVDVIFIDDEQYLLDGFRMLACNRKVDTYSDPQSFLDKANQYPRDTKIMLDQNFANSPLKGNQIAETLHGMGFTRLYLLSGERLSDIQIPHYLTPIFKSDLNHLQATLNE